MGALTCFGCLTSKKERAREQQDLAFQALRELQGTHAELGDGAEPRALSPELAATLAKRANKGKKISEKPLKAALRGSNDQVYVEVHASRPDDVPSGDQQVQTAASDTPSLHTTASIKGAHDADPEAPSLHKTSKPTAELPEPAVNSSICSLEATPGPSPERPSCAEEAQQPEEQMTTPAPKYVTHSKAMLEEGSERDSVCGSCAVSPIKHVVVGQPCPTTASCGLPAYEKPASTPPSACCGSATRSNRSLPAIREDAPTPQNGAAAYQSHNSPQQSQHHLGSSSSGATPTQSAALGQERPPLAAQSSHISLAALQLAAGAVAPGGPQQLSGGEVTCAAAGSNAAAAAAAAPADSSASPAQEGAPRPSGQQLPPSSQGGRGVPTAVTPNSSGSSRVAAAVTPFAQLHGRHAGDPPSALLRNASGRAGAAAGGGGASPFGLVGTRAFASASGFSHGAPVAGASPAPHSSNHHRRAGAQQGLNSSIRSVSSASNSPFMPIFSASGAARPTYQTAVYSSASSRRALQGALSRTSRSTQHSGASMSSMAKLEDVDFRPRWRF